MSELSSNFERDQASDGAGLLHFTPSEWRVILKDVDFLHDPANDYRVPRRLMGVEVRIVPDHHFG